MARFVIRRLIAMLAVLFAISVITFLIFNVIPNGDPAVRLAGKSPPPEVISAIAQPGGFDKPVPVQYVKTMEKVFTGDLVSYTNNINVIDEIAQGFPVTLSLALGAGIMRMTVAVALGLLTAVKAGVFADRARTVLALIGVSRPVFLVGALLWYFLGFTAVS